MTLNLTPRKCVAHLHDTVRAAARTAGRSLDHHPLTRQMFREGFAHRLAAREGAHCADRVLRCRLFSRLRILGRCGLQLLKLQFQLIDQSCAAL